MSEAAGAGQPAMIKDAAYYAEKIRRQRAKRRAKSGDSTDSDEEEEIKRLVREKLKADKRKAKGLPRKHEGLFKYLKERDAKAAKEAQEAKEEDTKPDIRSDTGVLAVNSSRRRRYPSLGSTGSDSDTPVKPPRRKQPPPEPSDSD